MIKIDDIRDSLENQILADANELVKLQKERKKLHGAFVRYGLLMERLKETEERLVATASLIQRDPYVDTEGMKDYLAERGIQLERDIKSYLWMAMREILRQVVEIQVVELEQLLNGLRMKVSRAAIESALETHKDVFRIIRRGRQKFIALK